MYKVELKKNKRYKLCSCGVSKSLPFCDNQHRKYNEINNTDYKSIKISSSNDIEIDLESSKWIEKTLQRIIVIKK